MSSKTVKMLQTVEDSHVLADPEEMKVTPVPGHVVTPTTDKRDRVLTQSRVGKFMKGGTYEIPASQAEELVLLGYAQEVSA